MYEGSGDLEHVRVLGEFQEVPLQLFFVPRHLTELHLQPLKLLLNITFNTSLSLNSAVKRELPLTHASANQQYTRLTSQCLVKTF